MFHELNFQILVFIIMRYTVCELYASWRTSHLEIMSDSDHWVFSSVFPGMPAILTWRKQTPPTWIDNRENI